MIRGIHHTSISTPDYDRLVAFYRDVVGAELVNELEWEEGRSPEDTVIGLTDTSVRLATLRLGNAFIEVQQYRNPVGRSPAGERPPNDHGISHFCLDVVDIEEEYERLAAAGTRFVSPPVDTGGGVWAAYARDPDGNIFELQEIRRAGAPFRLHDHPRPLQI